MTTPSRLAWAGLTIGAAAAAMGAWSIVRPNGAPINVVVITLDTTRADRLSPYGFQGVSLPAIERLAREGVVFDQAATAVPLTLPAHTSLFTGLLPPHHGVRDNADAPLAASTATLAETLRARGFHTGAFVGSIVLDPDRGLQRGFDVYRGVRRGAPGTAESRQRPANEVITDAIEWLDTVPASPFFLWAHLYDAHRPYAPPEPYRTAYAHDLYLGEIAFADSQIGRLIDELDRRHVLDRTLIVVTGDHGESLGEHGERDHGVFVYESVLHVPLIVRSPGVPAARVASVVQLIDVMPTVFDLLRMPAPPTDGISLTGVMAGHEPSHAVPAYAESLYPERLGWSRLLALREGRFKFIDAPKPELYDLDDDPAEQANIFETHRDVADAMRVRASAYVTGPVERPATQPSPASPRLLASLRSLGYVAEAAPQPSAAPEVTRPDPKDCIGHIRPGVDLSPIFLRCGPWVAFTNR